MEVLDRVEQAKRKLRAALSGGGGSTSAPVTPVSPPQSSPLIRSNTEGGKK